MPDEFDPYAFLDRLCPPELRYSPLPPRPLPPTTFAAAVIWTPEEKRKYQERIAALQEQARVQKVQFDKWQEQHALYVAEEDRKFKEHMDSRFSMKPKNSR